MTIQLDKEIEDKYEVLAIMGEGGMGAVYKVRHRYLEEVQVIKLMRHQLQGSENVRARFLREAKTAKKLRHPNIAEVMDYDVTSAGTAFIVMEFVEGINLRELMARSGGKFEPQFAADAGIQTLSALEYLHGKGFVHRDISPDNLMVTRHEGKAVIKLIDLGIAKSIEGTSNLTIDGKFVGKILYASPEQLDGEFDRRSDLYSLGVALYEMLTGTPPITGSDYRSIIAGVLTQPPRSFDETDPQGIVPTALRQAILKALEKDPDNRYPTADAFAAALRAAMPTVPEGTDESAITTQITTSPAREADRKTEVLSDESEATVVPTIVSDSTSTPTVVTDDASARPTRRHVFRGAIAATVLLCAIVIAWLQTRPAQTTGGKTPPKPEPPVVQTGELIIKGLPWGEVVEVLDTAGKNQVTANPLYTPAVLKLPSGTYRVRVSNPVLKKSDVVVATVSPGKVANSEVKLEALDAATYLKEVMQ